jgi:hypothetical protein
VSSYDDRGRQEAHDRQEAKEAWGILRELEKWCADPTKQINPQLEPIRGMLESKLRIAETLLGENDDMGNLLNHLRLQFGRSEEINIDLIQSNIVFIALVARALEERFNLQPGGGGGDTKYSTSDFLQVEWPKII